MVVVGAGFGGLACAYELRCAGCDVVVVEARKRVGGRVLSFNAKNGNEFAAGRNVEGGGELIGSNHPTWQQYARRFGLKLLDVTESEDPGPIHLRGRALSDGEARDLYKGMEPIFAELTREAAGVDAERPWEMGPEIDMVSVAQRLSRIKGDELALYAAGVQLAADNAVPTARQSLLGMLACIKGGGLERYWTHSETHRCEGGNQRLALALAREVGKSRVLLGTPVAEIDTEEAVGRVTLADGSVLECDEVVLAVPPSVWQKIAMRPKLPWQLSPQMGEASKYLAAVKSRFWEEARRSPDAFSDGPINETWDGTDGQRGPGPAVLVGFSGARDSEPRLADPMLGKRSGTDRRMQMEALHPGFEGQFMREAHMDWPRDEWTGAGYSFPSPGEVTRNGPVLHEGLGRLHFVGEHACYRFCGYMEGGLSSGAAVARRIAGRSGVGVG